jgi:uracil-DNA glycosylase family 4
MSNYVPGAGPHDAKLMVVGEAPGAVEDQSGVPFSGPSGELLNEMLDAAGMKRRDVYVTNVVKYRPPFNQLPRLREIGHSIDEGIPQLWDEIYAIKPNCIVALGNLSLLALTGKGKLVKDKKTGNFRKITGITTYRGSILSSLQGNFKVLPTIHPASLLRSQTEGVVGEKATSYSARLYIQHDLNRAVAQAQFPEFRLPKRTLEIARSRVDIWRFLDLYKDKFEVSVDIEVLHAIPVCVALAFNEWHAISIPLVDVWGMQGKDSGISDSEFDHMWRMLAAFLSRSDIKVIGQNFKFDDTKLRRPCGIVIKNVFFDNLLAAHALHCELPKSQAFLTSIYTEEPYYKDEGKEFDVKRSPAEQLFYYNAKDAAVAFEIRLRLEEAGRALVVPGFPNWFDEFFLDYTMSLHPLYRDIEGEGFPVDEQRRAAMILDYKERVVVNQKRLEEICGWDVNVMSPKQVALLLYKDFRLPNRTGRKGKNEDGSAKSSTSEETLVALQSNVCKDPNHREAIDLILKIRGYRKAIGSYMEAPVDFDGRMRTSIRIAGTETGRTSNTKLGQPERPPFKNKKGKPTELGLAFQTMSKHGEMGKELRTMFIADPGHVIMEFDLSQAEARIVALLGRSLETLELFNKTDIHKLTSTWIFSMPMNVITKEMRFIGKTCRHAGNYDMRKRRLMELVNTDAKKYGIKIDPISEYKAGQMLDRFHSFSPWIRQVFHTEIVEALQDNNMMLVNPFGRQRTFNDWWGEDLWKEAYAQLPQSTVADQVKHAALRIRSRIPGIRIIVEAHDALVFMTPNSEVERHARIIKEELEVPIDFSRCTLSRGELVIPCEAKLGDNYKELKDFDLKQVA